MTSKRRRAPARSSPFARVPRDAAGHFRLRLYAAVLRVIARIVAASESFEAAFERYPFLANYANELVAHGLEGVPAHEAEARWLEAVREWEEGVEAHLPLRALRASVGLDDEESALLLTIGLPEFDARFGALFEILNGAQGVRRPSMGLLATWWAGEIDVFAAAGRLRRLGLVMALDPTAPRADWQLAIPARIWDAMRGALPKRVAAWATHRPAEALPALDELVIEDALAERLGKIADALAEGRPLAVVARGPKSNGRGTVLAALARAAGRGVLEIDAAALDEARWGEVAPLATLLDAMPVIRVDPEPGKTAEIPELEGYAGPLGVVLGRMGGVNGPALRQAIGIDLDIPGPEERRRHWAAAFDGTPVEDLDGISAGFRLTRGNIRRAAALAVQQAALRRAKRVTVKHADVQAASRSLNREALDTLAMRLGGGGDWTHLATSDATFNDLSQLEARCRNRERLGALAGRVGGLANPGVRALFKGASGTGKTLAARLLAAALGMDLYRLDLSAVINKYIGETEKNLERAFSRAEELDVILLLDEGDSMLTRRTEVNTANDRYANLETNYLLQRMESYTGILLVTTNAAADRIDGAFTRRMDAVIDFAPPQAQQRYAIWDLHLPDGHAVDKKRLWELADRCALTGGQIRNATLHAALLAMGEGAPIGTDDVVAAVRREYRKSGTVCPLPAGA